MSVLKLCKIINTRDRAAKKFREERWKRGFGCVRCGSIKVYKHAKLKNGLQKYRCHDCHHVFSDQSTTQLRWNKLKIDRIATLNHLSRSTMTIRDLARESEMNKNSALRLRSKIRSIRGRLYEAIAPPECVGTVEMDETKLGKRWFWGVLERKTGRAIVEMVANRGEILLGAKIWKYVKEESVIITDGWGGYQPHPRYYHHFRVNHSKYFVHPQDNKVHTNNIENLWRQLKRKINHFYNGVTLEHIQSYIDEYFYLKNHAQPKKPTFFPLYCDKT